MSPKLPFAILRTFKGIVGEPKSIKKLQSSDLLIETTSALQSKYFLLAKAFSDPLLVVNPYKSLNSFRDVISEPNLLCASEAGIQEGLADQGVTHPSVSLLETTATPSNSQPSNAEVGRLFQGMGYFEFVHAVAVHPVQGFVQVHCSSHCRRRKRLWFLVKCKRNNGRLADIPLSCKRRRMIRVNTE
ncbi:uncharacterized protein TNCV_2588951 [Trichonephila clavipes]|nr:uncharacterized protein TNCV_2588951 [Trichonephila clavipes]